MTSTLRRCLRLAAALALSAGAAPFAAAGPAQPDVVAGLCAHVVGLMPGERHFAACVDSLSATHASLVQSERNSAARRACLGRGLQPGTAALAECVLTTADNQPTLVAGPAGDAPTPGGSRSYFVVSRETAIERDKLACARLGLDPTQEAFGACVADLRSALARASEPAM